MAPKAKDPEEKAKALVLSYLKEVNRPYGAIDITANLKGAIAKTQTPKVLAALAERGEISQKTYAKSIFYVAKQSDLEDIPSDKLKALEEECAAVQDSSKILQTELKSLQQALTKLKSTPTDSQLSSINAEYASKALLLEERLAPLRAGVRLISAEELANIETKWIQMRAEWISRRKVAKDVWSFFTEDRSPQESVELADTLGIEADSPEHERLERGPLCSTKQSRVLKRKQAFEVRD
ncbi:TBPIP-domain-containing protein [Sistotremastrum niveocremeum HHB9708]|uniref:TBPIP-domain-containing protein n=2 Tax=Sistotremastraceae TaxID=3402574 RepID=A0A164TQJ3_9AGAM|nr:TBPIP-domain-containing protein [Sistotremastrum niveocremeum HHB9708]KZT42225.1 TBPIP-domain-containing protein [Sistotremastrum suecicum HHB10207 ss-3]